MESTENSSLEVIVLLTLKSPSLTFSVVKISDLRGFSKFLESISDIIIPSNMVNKTMVSILSRIELSSSFKFV